MERNKGTSHSVTLSGLTPGTMYHYQALSKDAQGNLGSSADFTFTTATNPPVISNVSSGSITTTGATITWTTDKASDSQVAYRLAGGCGGKGARDSNQVT